MLTTLEAVRICPTTNIFRQSLPCL